MFAFGNKFGSRSKLKPEMIPSDPPATLSEPQAALDLVTKAHTTKRAELTAAREQLVQIEQRLGEQLADGIDAGPEILSMQAAQLTIKQLETTCEALSQRQSHAQRALTDATRAQAEAVTAEARARILALGPRGEELLASVAQYAKEMDDALAALRRLGGNETYTYHSNEITGQWHLFLGLTKHGPKNRQVVSPFMRYATWTDCLEKTCG